jgi:hypothetical protein
MTTIATQQPNALDATNGGTWTLGSNANVNGTGALKLLHCELTAGGVSSVKHTLTVDGAGGGSVLWGGTALPALVSRTYTFTQPLCGIGPYVYTLDWAWGASCNWVQHTTTGEAIWIPFTRLPNRATIDSVDVWISGSTGAGHSGSLPANPIQASLVYKAPNSESSVSYLGPTADNPGSAGAYDALHILSSTGGGPHTFSSVALAITSNSAFYVMIEGENGANSVADTTAILGVEVNCTCTEVAPG